MMVCVSLPLILTVLLTETSASLLSPRGQQASACPPRWLRLGQRCFAFYPVWSSWSSAQLMCSQTGGDLASLHTPEEKLFVHQMVHTHTPVWLGGYQTQQNVSWFWSDASVFRIDGWTNQTRGKTNEGGACMQMDPKSAELQSAPCGELRFYICSTKAGSSSYEEPHELGVAPPVSLVEVLWGFVDVLVEEILLRAAEMTQRCPAGFLQQEALYLQRISSTLEVLVGGLKEEDETKPLLLETLKHYRNQWLLSSLLSFHSVVKEESVYWLVALSARARLRHFLLERNDGGREEKQQEAAWIHRYRKLVERQQDQMDAFKAINIFREQMMNQKSFYKAADCDLWE